MPLYERFKLIFFHNPKAGGSSIEKLLEMVESPELLFDNYHTSLSVVALQHLPYTEVQRLLPAEKFDAYFKFTIVRNPWERLLSDYIWNNRNCKTFTEYVSYVDHIYQNYGLELSSLAKCPDMARHFLGHLLPQHLYTGPDVTVYRFENFATDISSLVQLLGINKPIPHANARAHEHYSKYYDNSTKAIVEKIYARDIALFGYKFELI